MKILSLHSQFWIFSPVCYLRQESLLFERSFSSVPNQLPRNPEMIFHDQSHILSIFQTEVFLNIEIAEILLWSTNVSSATAHSSIFLKQLFKSLKMGIRHALEKMNTSAVGAGRRDFFQLKFIFSKYFSVGFPTFFFLRYGMCVCLPLSFPLCRIEVFRTSQIHTGSGMFRLFIKWTL